MAKDIAELMNGFWAVVDEGIESLMPRSTTLYVLRIEVQDRDCIATVRAKRNDADKWLWGIRREDYLCFAQVNGIELLQQPVGTVLEINRRLSMSVYPE